MKCCVEWIRLGITEMPWTVAAEAYETAINLLPHFYWLEIDPASRLRALTPVPLLACDASGWFVKHGDVTRAVELLEQGRGVFWSNNLHIKSVFESLPADLEGNLVTISRQLQSRLSSVTPPSSIETLEQRKLQMEWIDTVAEIRRRPGFEHFLRPKPFLQLARAAKGGPIVILVTSRHHCFALVIHPSCPAPQYIPLEEINLEGAIRLVYRWNEVLQLSSTRNSSPDIVHHENSINLNSQIHRILGDLWDQVVEPVLLRLNLTTVSLNLLGGICADL
jgi:hypothetical protein